MVQAFLEKGVCVLTQESIDHHRLTIETLRRVVGGVLKEGHESFAIVEFGPNVFDDNVHYRKLPVIQKDSSFSWNGGGNEFFACPIWGGEPITTEEVVALRFSESNWLFIDEDIKDHGFLPRHEWYAKHVASEVEVSLRKAAGQIMGVIGVRGFQGTQGNVSPPGMQGTPGFTGPQGLGP